MSANDPSPLARHPDNPIIAPRDMPVECSAVFNAGAVRYGDKHLLLLRVEDYARRCDFHVATSDDGVHFDVNPEPIDYPLREIEKSTDSLRFDMRITPLDGAYYVCHAVWLTGIGCTIGIARTEDFVRFEPVGGVSVPSNRNAVLFPDKINGMYARLERPFDSATGGMMWVSYSPDLELWGRSEPVRIPTEVWNWHKTGAGPVPIRTDKGWLEIYHATAKTASTENYYLGVVLLDLEDPSKIVAAGRKFLLQPEELYECTGQVPNVVFTCGATQSDDGALNVYYAGADSCVCLATTTVNDLLAYCLDNAH